MVDVEWDKGRARDAEMGEIDPENRSALASSTGFSALSYQNPPVKVLAMNASKSRSNNNNNNGRFLRKEICE
jgi:hypothetical protein